MALSLDETKEVELEEEAPADPVNPTPDDAQDDGQPEQPAGEEVITLGGEPAPEEPRAPDWLRDLRKSNREKERRIRELESQLQAPSAPVALGEKPTLKGCDYDDEKFEAALGRAKMQGRNRVAFAAKGDYKP